MADADISAQINTLHEQTRQFAAGQWWSIVPANLQQYILKKAGLPADTRVDSVGRLERGKLIAAAQALIASVEPVTRMQQ